MQLLYPLFALAGLLIGVPILIHLFHFRRYKRVQFTNVRFLKEIKEETDARTKLKNLLTLLARCLAVLALVFAFAQPFWKGDNIDLKANRWVSIYVDNSFSMLALSEEVPLIELAKKRATDIVKSYKVSDRFQILTNDLGLGQQRMVDQETALRLIEDIKIRPNVQPLQKIIEKQGALLNSIQNDAKQVYLISDFQQNMVEGSLAAERLDAEVNIIPLRSIEQNNVSIDTAYFESAIPLAGQTSRLVVKVSNQGRQAVEGLQISLEAEGQIRPVGTLYIDANSQKLDTIGFILQKVGWHDIKLTIADHPIQFDDQYLISVEVPEKINTLIIHQNTPNKYVESALEASGLFDVKKNSSQQIDYNGFGKYKLIVLEDLDNLSSGLVAELSKYVQNGGNVVIFPGKNADLNAYNSMWSSLSTGSLSNRENQKREVNSINTEEYVFKEVFEGKAGNFRYPSTQYNYPIKRGAQGEEWIMKYKDGSTYIAKYKRGNGNLYLCASPLDTESSDLVQNASIFAPMMYRMALSSLEKVKYAYIIGQDEQVQAKADNSQSEVSYTIKGKTEFIPQHTRQGNNLMLGLQGQIKEAGYYYLTDKDSTKIASFAFNNSRQESRMQFADKSEIEKYFTHYPFKVLDQKETENFVAQLDQKNKGSLIWRYLLMAALIFLGLETFIIRFWKK